MRYAFIVPVLSLLALGGCASLLVSAGTNAGVAVAQNRSIGRTVDDNIIYGDLTTRFMDTEENNLLTKVTFNVRFARVMLTGTVENEGQALRAVELAWKAKGVSEVINELQVNPGVSFFDKANDTLIKRNLETRYLITKGVWVINYSMDVQNGVAYLIGRVKDRAELDRALNIARTTKGVKRVVSHLQINTDVERPTTQDGQPSVSAEPSPYAHDAAVPSVRSGGSNLGAGGGQDVYTGPVYGGGSISSSPN